MGFCCWQRRGLLFWFEALSAYRHHGMNYWVSNPFSHRDQLALYEWLLNHPKFGKVFPDGNGICLRLNFAKT